MDSALVAYVELLAWWNEYLWHYLHSEKQAQNFMVSWSECRYQRDEDWDFGTTDGGSKCLQFSYTGHVVNATDSNDKRDSGLEDPQKG